MSEFTNNFTTNIREMLVECPKCKKKVNTLHGIHKKYYCFECYIKENKKVFNRKINRQIIKDLAISIGIPIIITTILTLIILKIFV